MVTRVRIDAEASTTEEVLADLDAAFAEILNRWNYIWNTSSSNTGNFTITGQEMNWAGTGVPTTYPYISFTAPQTVFYGEQEFVEEVIETAIRSDGAIYRKGRRIIRFVHPTFEEVAGLVE